MFVSDPVRDVLISKSDLLFWGLVGSTAVLFVGVIMEEFHPLDRLPTHDVNTRTRVRNPRKWVVRSKFAYAKLALLMVVGGLAGEGIFEYLAARAETGIRQYDEQILSDTIKQAGDAAKSAKTAHDEADAVAVRARALERNLSADESREAEVSRDVSKLLAKVGDRHLTADQEHNIGVSLGLPGKKLSFIVLSKEEEVTGIAHDIFNAVGIAQWDRSFFTAPINTEPMRGIVVEILAGRSGKGDNIAASRLVNLLRAYLDVDGPVSVRELPNVFPYSVDKFTVGSERGEGVIDPEAHIRIIIGKK